MMEVLELQAQVLQQFSVGSGSGVNGNGITMLPTVSQK
jgi:hypothetical protein